MEGPELRILGFLCNSVFFFEKKFSAVVENIALNAKYVFHYLVEDRHRSNYIPVHHDGSGSQRKKWIKKKLALLVLSPRARTPCHLTWHKVTCSIFTFAISVFFP